MTDDKVGNHMDRLASKEAEEPGNFILFAEERNGELPAVESSLKSTSGLLKNAFLVVIASAAKQSRF